MNNKYRVDYRFKVGTGESAPFTRIYEYSDKVLIDVVLADFCKVVDLNEVSEITITAIGEREA
jgi:hypothetical protein